MNGVTLPPPWIRNLPWSALIASTFALAGSGSIDVVLTALIVSVLLQFRAIRLDRPCMATLLFVIRIHQALSGIVLDRHTHTRARWHSQGAVVQWAGHPQRAWRHGPSGFVFGEGRSHSLFGKGSPRSISKHFCYFGN